MRPDRRDFTEPGDLVYINQGLEGISSIIISPDCWTWEESAEVVTGFGGPCIVVGTGPGDLGLKQNTLYLGSAIPAGHARYVLTPVSLGWFLHDETRVEMKLDERGQVK